MVRALLIVLLCAGAGACAGASETASARAGEGHEALACAACHTGPRVDKGQASVPREACTASGCHADAGPPQVSLATASFEHRNHAVNGDVALSCAGCHTHDTGDAPLRASLDACALCHTSQLANTRGAECKLCHAAPRHEGMTSQGIPVAHGALTMLETGCDRCHYDVLETQKKVSLETCSSCHERVPDVTKQGIARDLHPKHKGVQCTACHQAGLHRIGAMSSAVNLQCADCHDTAHRQTVKQWRGYEACAVCHRDVHGAQQRLVLGFVKDEPVLPSAKFMMGLTCRSCHVPPGAATASDEPRRGQAAACRSCHEQEFGRVLEWWLNGVKGRSRSVAGYVSAAQRMLADAPDTSRVLLARAQELLALVDEAGGQHNLELSDLIFRTSLADATSAYRLAGKTAPAAPALGNTPHVGTCSFCHYGANEKWNYQALSPELHERLVKTRK